MSSSDRERMRNSESMEFPIKSEMEDSFPNSEVKMENNDLVVSVGLFDDGSLFMDPDVELKAETEIEFKAEPDMEFKAEPELFESSEGDMKYSFNSDASVAEEDLQISKREVRKEEESVKTGVKEEYTIQCVSSRKEDRGNRRRSGKEYLQNEEQTENSGCEKPLCQERDSKTHTDVGMREKSYMGGNYEEQSSGVVYPSTQMVTDTGGEFRWREGGKTFSKQVDLKAHYETHTRRRSFKCSDCGKVFSLKCLLIIHLRTHTGEKPFKCSVCDKAFSMRKTVTRHYKIHTGEKPFKCSVCGKAFSQRNHLTTHNRIHTGEKPFKCSICDMAFVWKCLLSRHMKNCAGENM